MGASKVLDAAICVIRGYDPIFLPAVAAVAFTHDRRIVGTQERDSGSDVAFYANLGAFAGNASAVGPYPKPACAVIELVNAFAQEPDRLRHLADDVYLFIHKASGIRRDGADLGALTTCQRKSQCQNDGQVSDSLCNHVFSPNLLFVACRQVINQTCNSARHCSDCCTLLAAGYCSDAGARSGAATDNQ